MKIDKRLVDEIGIDGVLKRLTITIGRPPGNLAFYARCDVGEVCLSRLGESTVLLTFGDSPEDTLRQLKDLILSKAEYISPHGIKYLKGRPFVQYDAEGEVLQKGTIAGRLSEQFQIGGTNGRQG